ncbi:MULTISPECIES: GNAT family N-acetyltransferase [Stenotrophomonas]|uniref:Ribosomal protein S18 acetylase RimI-like enzyme n=1 Tax=Stenotrophomonas rhizophila TaxID=216778 RepID=A0A498C3C3_9GAMM|nr:MULTISPECIES: GNAT family N-acetyltransferase [Stenotrophomonas]RLK49962.1 ribosomal protein S18 acetylase RimI-like enzyme [Stenotrophomonas rhizophila]
MSTLTYRAATLADIPALVTLVTSAYRGDASRAGWTTEADILDGARIDPQGLQADIERPRSTILLAERGSQLLACAHIADDQGKGYFGMFSVDPTQQGGGIGKQVMLAAEAHAAREWGVPVMQMTVIDIRDELIAFYERRGYQRTGIKKPFPYGDERFGIPKRDDLRFEILEKPLAVPA